MRPAWRILLALGILAGAAVLGLWLGNLSVPTPPPPPPADRPAARVDPPGEHDEPETYIDPGAPPVFLHAPPESNGDWGAAESEIRMAAAAGLHQYLADVPAPWDGAAGLASTLAPVERVLAADPEAVFLLRVNLNPPDTWLHANREHAAHIAGQAMRYTSPVSALWQEAARAALSTLAEAANEPPLKGRVLGYVPGALEQQVWKRSGYDTSPANLAGFREWLGRRYADDAALQAAWQQDGAGLDTAQIPEPVSTDGTDAVFFDLPAMQPHVDFLAYTSESTADAIAALAVHLKPLLGPGQLVLAPYGYTFEHFDAHTGHFALGAIIDSDLDGYISPVTYHDRGLGETGAIMGPVDSVHNHGQRWIAVDDTRTGMGFDPETGAFARMKGLRDEDVFNVQRRNFATALIRADGLVWSDPEGRGWLHDEEQWRLFQDLHAIYRDAHAARGTQTPALLDQDGGATNHRPLVVVADETSRFYQRCGEPLSAALFNHTRNAALRGGTPVSFVLLQDLLDGRLPPAPVYLFLNAFRLTDAQREKLHGMLAGQEAVAIWMYAPGYITGAAAVEHVAKTTGMRVRAFDAPTEGGSYYMLPGRWCREREPFGVTRTWSPLFYIDDDDADVVGRYVANDRASAAVKFLEEGWTSVYVAEPMLSPPVLRELLHILEQDLYFRDPRKAHYDVLRTGGGLIAIHGRDLGERAIEFGQAHDVEDLFDARAGWPMSRSIIVPMRAGETRLLRLRQAQPEAEASGGHAAPETGEEAADTTP